MDWKLIAVGAMLLLWRFFLRKEKETDTSTPPDQGRPEVAATNHRQEDYWDKHEDACFTQLKCRYSDSPSLRNHDDGRYSVKF